MLTALILTFLALKLATHRRVTFDVPQDGSRGMLK